MSLFKGGQRKAPKRGSLSLSINAIVVLIMAITMLGLGLGFIKGMFGKVSQNVEQMIAQEADAPRADSSHPITVSNEYKIIIAGEDQVMKVGVYNTEVTPLTGFYPEITTCTGAIDAAFSISSENQISNPKTIQPGERTQYNLVFTIPSTAVNGKYLCQMKVTDGTIDKLTSFWPDITMEVTG
ncbi:MAG: hypothetical protein ABIH34_02215 [Nanoarchaeota archaeon]